MAILKQSQAVNQTEVVGNQKRWTSSNDESADGFYDDDYDDDGQKSASNYISMKVKPNVQTPSYQPNILLVPDQPSQPVQNVIVTKINAPVKAQYSKPAPVYGKPTGNYPQPAPKNPYDTPPGTFTPQSYGGPSNYGKYVSIFNFIAQVCMEKAERIFKKF